MGLDYKKWCAVVDWTRHSLTSRHVILGLLLLVSYAYFYEAGGWNQNSRFDLVRAIIARHSLQIDAFHQNTGDEAIHDGHVYSDKAPGLALSALPIVAVADLALRTVDIDPESERGIAAASYIATVAVDGVPTAAAAVCLSFIALKLFGNESAATFAALSFGLATPAWAYATLFIGHALATACLVCAFGAALALAAADVGRARLYLAFLVGVAGGWATVTELTAAVPAALIAALALFQARSAKGTDRFAVAGAVFAGAIMCAVILATFNAAAFGSPFSIGYASEAGDFKEMKAGLFGITYPKPPVIAELLVGSYRGLLPLAPLMALAPVGFWIWFRSSSHRKPMAVAAMIPAYYLLLNSSYFYWEGGWSYGPRHMAPALPFLALSLAPLWSAARRPVRVGLAAMCACGICITLIGVSTTPQPPSIYDRPFSQLWWPAFLDGDLSLNHTSFTQKGWNPLNVRNHPDVHQAWNLGERVGLRGRMSLMPLLAAWSLGAAWWLTRSIRSRVKPRAQSDLVDSALRPGSWVP